MFSETPDQFAIAAVWVSTLIGYHTYCCKKQRLRAGQGSPFILPVEHIIGLESHLERIPNEMRDQYF